MYHFHIERSYVIDMPVYFFMPRQMSFYSLIQAPHSGAHIYIITFMKCNFTKTAHRNIFQVLIFQYEYVASGVCAVCTAVFVVDGDPPTRKIKITLYYGNFKVILTEITSFQDRPDNMVELKRVSLLRGGKYLLRDINWKIRKGENWVLFGKNGSGKTMLLEVITGYVYPSMGEVSLFGKGSGEYDVREIRKRFGYVSTPLRSMFNPGDRLLDVVLSGYYATIGLYEEPAAEQVERATELLAAVRMESRANDIFGILSDGEKQKILMCRALAGNPEMLILDEPASGLDIPSREDLLNTIEDLHCRYNRSVLYVTHRTEEITPMFKKMVIIEQGRIFYKGDVSNALSGDMLKRLFNQPVEVYKLNKRYYTILRGE